MFKVGSPFDRRITSLIWHPKLITTLAVGSKGGDIVLWNHQNKSHHLFIQGVISGCCTILKSFPNHFKTHFFIKSGPGGSIQAMKFDLNEENQLYTCSIDGTVLRRDLSSNKSFTYLDTGIRCTE